MRSDRSPNPRSTRPHALYARRTGINRYKQGMYLCKCGASFSSIGAYEKHRADERKRENGRND